MWEVIDIVYTEKEGNVVFRGTREECLDWIAWIAQQPDSFTYRAVLHIEQH